LTPDSVTFAMRRPENDRPITARNAAWILSNSVLMYTIMIDARTPAPFRFRFRTLDEIVPAPAGPPLWEGVVARGTVAVLTSRWKSGKTTLLTALLHTMAAGGTLAGRTVAAGRAVVVSEEPPSLWADRGRRTPLGSHVTFCCRPFLTRPTLDDWRSLLREAAAQQPDLLVIDPLAMVLPAGAENNPSSLLDVLTPLHALTDAGTAVLILHHPRKGSSVKATESVTPRGSGALAGFADTLLELDRVPAAGPDDRRRVLRGTSRHADPFRFTLELSADGTQYALAGGDADPESFETGWPVLRQVLSERVERVPVDRLLKEWPEGESKPSESTLRRWLERAVRDNLADRTGGGRRFDAFRYGLLGQTDLLPDLPPLGDRRQQEREDALYRRECDAILAGPVTPAVMVKKKKSRSKVS
jgi:AAA domain